MIKILLVEDNSLVREILSDMIDTQDDFQLAGAAENGLEALKLLEEGLHVDIVVADFNMKGMDGIELTGNLTALYSGIRVIILTMHAKTGFVNRAISAGARGYLIKNGDMPELYEAIRRVKAGEIVIEESTE